MLTIIKNADECNPDDGGFFMAFPTMFTKVSDGTYHSNDVWLNGGGEVDGLGDVWTPNPYTITLNGNGATTAGTASVVATFDSATLAPSAITNPQRTGYSFEGWTTAQNGGEVVIGTDGKLVANVEITTKATISVDEMNKLIRNYPDHLLSIEHNDD